MTETNHEDTHTCVALVYHCEFFRFVPVRPRRLKAPNASDMLSAYFLGSWRGARTGLKLT